MHPTTSQTTADARRTIAAQVDIVTQADRVLGNTGLSVPEGWHMVHTRREHHNDQAITVTRYQPRPERVLGGEHVTVVIDDSATLLGYTRMSIDAADKPLPEPAAAQHAAFDWLHGFASDYAAKLAVQWVDQHDETITDDTGTEHRISGAKVKTRHTNGNYAWVIVNDGGQIITYERDIQWNPSAHRRITPMWMHDRWIAAREGTGAQPGPPDALATP